MSWSRSVEQEPINVGDANYDPRFPFGWGLRAGTGFSTKSSLQAARDSLATISGDAHVTAAVAYLDSLLVANVWKPDGSVSDPGATLRALQNVANELAATDAESFTQADGVVSAARDIAQANIVRNGGPDATNSPLIADADHALLINQPDVAVMLLTQASGDVLPPVTSVALEPAPVNDWITANPFVTLSATDDGVGVAQTVYRLDGGEWTVYSAPFQVTGDAEHSLDFYSTDNVGNVENTQSITFKVDATPPTIDLVAPVEAVTQVVGQPGNYPLDSVQNASYSCADNFSGLASCVGTVPNGSPFDTSTVGFHSFTVDAEDVAGNTATVTHQYNVVWDGYGGFTPPLSEGAINAARAGSTIPIKFSLGADYGLDIFAAGYPYSVQVDCTTQAEIGSQTPITDWKFADGYHTNWQTDRAWGGTCRQLIIKLLDNTVHTATFTFK
jgi:hypothetical protein